MATYTSFEQLPCWQKCQEIKLWVVQFVKTLPDHERYELAFSMRKCARSATRNLAEGFGKFTIPDKVNFCRTSKGSLFELLDDILTAHEEGYITTEQYSQGRKMIEAGIYSINGYITYLNSRRQGDWEPR